jgi:hypothetical protein
MILRRLARLVVLVAAGLAPALAAAPDETSEVKPEPESREQTPASPPLHRSPQAVKAQSKSAPTTAYCMNANTQCLLACPHTEESVELVCSNRCRANLRTCTARVKKAASGG